MVLTCDKCKQKVIRFSYDCNSIEVFNNNGRKKYILCNNCARLLIAFMHTYKKEEYEEAKIEILYPQKEE